MAKASGFGVCAAFGLLLAVALSSCGRAATKDDSTAGQPSCEGAECAGAGMAIGGSPGGGDDDPPTQGGVGLLPEGGGGPALEACEPGTRSCDESSVRLCGEDGQSSTIEETCTLSQVCSAGECVGIACVPGSTFCADGAVLKCNEQGTAGEELETCDETQFCVERKGVAECSVTACEPDAGLCLNQTATACHADGSGPEPGGVDCAEQGLVCHDGECVDPTCTPGEKLCEHDDVYLCLGNGADAALFTDCSSGEVCDPVLAACRQRICEPGTLGCDASRIARCSALGLTWEQQGTDCENADQVCVSGACRTPTCTPSTTFCKDNDVYLCDAYGVGSTLSENCNDAYYHCAPYYSNLVYCAYNSCTPGTPVCSGNVLTQCADDGSGPVAGGTDCGTDKVCSGTTCQAKVCEPNQYFCKDGHVYACYPDGLGQYVAQACSDDATCRQTGASFACVPYTCTPGLKACLTNQIGVCGDDGMMLGSITQSCAATNEVCTSNSACGASAVDTIGAAEELQSVSSGYFFGDVIDVHSHRNLIQLEANLLLAGTRSLRWVVLEQTADTYYFEAVYDKLVSGQSGTGYISSGPLSYVLKAGRRYLLGVAVSEGGFVSYYDAKPWPPEVSFGVVRGGFAIEYSTSIYAYYMSADRVYGLRVTTELP